MLTRPQSHAASRGDHHRTSIKRRYVPALFFSIFRIYICRRVYRSLSFRFKHYAGRAKELIARVEARMSAYAPVYNYYINQNFRLNKRYFDVDWYFEQHPDVEDGRMDAVKHYIAHGIDKGFTARYFDALWYLQRYPDLQNIPLDAYMHYRLHGRREGREARYFYLTAESNRGGNTNYSDWLEQYDADSNSVVQAIHAIGALKVNPLFSLIVAPDNFAKVEPQHLRDTVKSILDQYYDHFEAIVLKEEGDGSASAVLNGDEPLDKRLRSMAFPGGATFSEQLNAGLAATQGAFVGVIRAGDTLSPDALYWLAEALQRVPDLDVLYTDEDKLSYAGRRHSPYFKCDFNYELMLTHNMLGHLTLYRRSFVCTLGGYLGYGEGASHYDLALRAIETVPTDRVGHVARPLYHARERQAGASEIAERQEVVRRHLERLAIDAAVAPVAELPSHTRVRYALPETPPKVSLIVPTRDRVDLLKVCIESVLAKTTYPNYEVLIIDNGSVEPGTLAYFTEIRDPRVRILRDESPFNFSALNNRAVRAAEGDIVCLMNNDIEIITPDWLEEMTSFACRPEIGCVGARLWYPDDTIQHAGVLVGFHGVAGHMHKFFKRGETGYAHRAVLHQALSAVTAAVLVVRKDIYEAVGGLDEAFAVAFNDVDFCLRVRDAGYRNIYTPYAEMYHHESASRGQDTTPEKKARGDAEIQLMKERWGETLMRDPAYSPNLTLTREDLSFAYPPRRHSLDA